MSVTITKYKLFWGYQDEKQEMWLRSMAQQGLHLVDINPLGGWTFRRGEPADIVYRIGALGDSRSPGFRQFVQDAGWTLAATTYGWQYWCAPAVAGKAPELYTDRAAQARRLKLRLYALAFACLPLFAWLFMPDKQRMMERLGPSVTVPLGLILAMFVVLVPYTALGLLKRIRQLRPPLPI